MAARGGGLWRTLRTLWHDYNNFGKEACSRVHKRSARERRARAVRLLTRAAAQELAALQRQNAALAEQIAAVRGRRRRRVRPVVRSLTRRSRRRARATRRWTS